MKGDGGLARTECWLCGPGQRAALGDDRSLHVESESEGELLHLFGQDHATGHRVR